MYSSCFIRTCLYQLSLASRVFSPNRPTCSVPLMYSVLILSVIVTPSENHNIFTFSIDSDCIRIPNKTPSNLINIQFKPLLLLLGRFPSSGVTGMNLNIILPFFLSSAASSVNHTLSYYFLVLCI